MARIFFFFFVKLWKRGDWIMMQSARTAHVPRTPSDVLLGASALTGEFGQFKAVIGSKPQYSGIIELALELFSM